MLKSKSGTFNRSFRHPQSELLSHAVAPGDFPIPKSGSVSRPRSRWDGLNETSTEKKPSENRWAGAESDAPFGLSLYLRQALTAPLLTRDQERSITRKISRYRVAFQRLVLQDPAVVTYLTDLLSEWESKTVRLDAVCNLALSDRVQRKILEPKIHTNLEILRGLPKRMKAARASKSVRRLQRTAVHLIEPLMIRPRHFESAPFHNPKATKILAEYRKLCQQLTCANMRLVVLIARRLCGGSPVLLDMIQEGVRGLMHAVTKFDHRRNIKFSTYATPWIKQTIYASLPNAQRNIRVPDNFRSLGREVQRRMSEVAEGHLDSGRNISLIAAEMGISASEVERLVSIQQDTCSLDQPQRGSTGASCLGELIADYRADHPWRIADIRERQGFARSLMDDVLVGKEHEVISLRFGITDGIDRSLAAVGREMGLTRERVRQLEKKAIEKMGAATGAVEVG